MLGYVEHKIVSVWLHLFLKRMAKKFPKFFVEFVSEYCETDKEKEIMRLRYVYKLKFKQIPDYVFVEERQVYKLHQRVIDNIISK